MVSGDLFSFRFSPVPSARRSSGVQRRLWRSLDPCADRAPTRRCLWLADGRGVWTPLLARLHPWLLRNFRADRIDRGIPRLLARNARPPPTRNSPLGSGMGRDLFGCRTLRGVRLSRILAAHARTGRRILARSLTPGVLFRLCTFLQPW